MKATSSEIQKYLFLLEETLERITASTAGIPEAQLAWKPDKKQWSLVEILAHLRACADLWTFSMYAMLAENEPELALMDERRWAKATGYAGLDFGESFQVFRLQRLHLLRVLEALPAESWTRAGLIGGRRHTVYSQARRMALHESEHCVQIETVSREISAGSQEF